MLALPQYLHHNVRHSVPRGLYKVNARMFIAQRTYVHRPTHVRASSIARTCIKLGGTAPLAVPTPSK